MPYLECFGRIEFGIAIVLLIILYSIIELLIFRSSSVGSQPRSFILAVGLDSHDQSLFTKRAALLWTNSSCKRRLLFDGLAGSHALMHTWWWDAHRFCTPWLWFSLSIPFSFFVRTVVFAVALEQIVESCSTHFSFFVKSYTKIFSWFYWLEGFTMYLVCCFQWFPFVCIGKN